MKDSTVTKVATLCLSSQEKRMFDQVLPKLIDWMPHKHGYGFNNAKKKYLY